MLASALLILSRKTSCLLALSRVMYGYWHLVISLASGGASGMLGLSLLWQVYNATERVKLSRP